MARAERYQITLIALGIIATLLMGVFFYRELFPEYKIYQDDYVALEEFRSTYTHEPPPAFKVGVKQIVQEKENKGPADIDRCISCHVALQLPHFSPTRIAHDINGNIVRDIHGTPVLEVNEDYVWLRLDQKIAQLTDAKVNEQLTQQGEGGQVASRLKEAEKLKALKTAEVGEHVYDVTKVLSMHPLIGKETRPFEFHSLDEYGCVSCHNGNGKGLTTERAHGPVFDGQYEIEFMGPKLEFLEKDQANDPRFSRVFNDKPGHKLLFQTTPIFVGSLIQAKCVQCHEQSTAAFRGLADAAGTIAGQRIKRGNAIIKGYENEKSALLTLLDLKSQLAQEGAEKVAAGLKRKLENPALLPQERERLQANLVLFSEQPGKDQQQLLDVIDQRLVAMLGSSSLQAALSQSLVSGSAKEKALDDFIEKERSNPDATGTLFAKWDAINLEQALLRHVEDTQTSLVKAASDESAVSAMTTDIDLLTKNYHRGQQLFVSQACYACHRIAGLARGGVGPELTRSGETYPWFIKESIVWPQADLRTSTMPNFQLDHVELEDLMTFLLGQQGPNKAVAATEYKIAVQEWEAGKKMAWEKPISPTQMRDLRYSMTVFATQGCAACHRLQGFESNVGYSIEKGKEKPNFGALYTESQWFQKLFPESVAGTDIVSIIDKYKDEIDKRIVDDVRKDALIEEIEHEYPGSIESLYSNFRFASRAKNAAYAELVERELDPVKKQALAKQAVEWKQRVNRVLMMYIQEYGLGRLIGPKPNWSGVFRSDEWLMEHFRNPAGHVPRSIMPILPFDDSKFSALTYMLDVLGRKNRDNVRGIWQNRGFNPEQAYSIHCAQCHGDYLQGNGPVAPWIYPIPKNLRNAEFLRNLTKEEAYKSIMHGVKGTPMPPWGETPSDKAGYDGVPVLTKQEINKLVDWLYTSLPGATVIKGIQDVPKWHYTPEDVIEELKREGVPLESGKAHERQESGSAPVKAPTTASLHAQEFPAELLAYFPKGDGYYASLQPPVVAVKADNQQEIEKIFDLLPNAAPGESKYTYYIKKSYYTDNNIAQGKKFFEMNCASCHGKEGDGSGMRASIMFDAKPRMLTNLDWIKTHDDIRLLRSIKYGVPGTAMTPWGDQTSALQRLQLVIFIRSLTEEKDLREALYETLYKAFDTTDAQIEMARALIYPTIEGLEAQSKKVRSQQSSGDISGNGGEASLYKEALKLYEQQLELAAQEKEWQALDKQLLSLKALVKQERDVYLAIGGDLIGLRSNESWGNFLKAVALNEGAFVVRDKSLHMQTDAAKNKERIHLLEEIASGLAKEGTAIDKEIGTASAKEQAVLKAQADQYRLLGNKILVGIRQLRNLQQEESVLFQAYQERLQALKQQKL